MCGKCWQTYQSHVLYGIDDPNSSTTRTPQTNRLWNDRAKCRFKQASLCTGVQQDISSSEQAQTICPLRLRRQRQGGTSNGGKFDDCTFSRRMKMWQDSGEPEISKGFPKSPKSQLMEPCATNQVSFKRLYLKRSQPLSFVPHGLHSAVGIPVCHWSKSREHRPGLCTAWRKSGKPVKTCCGSINS